MCAQSKTQPITPLRIVSIHLDNYRNLGKVRLCPGPRFNVISGPNGAGKSNLLEAIYYISALKSYRHSRTEDLISHDHVGCHMAARINGEVLPEDIAIVLSRTDPRKVRRNGKRPTSAAHYKTYVPAVIFHPGDIELPTGSPELRRTFIDRILEQMDPTYTATMNTYRHALRSRNRILKTDSKNVASIRAYDGILASCAEVIGISRTTLLEELSEEVSSAFHSIHGETHKVELTYAPSVAPNRNAQLSALEISLERDQQKGYTTRGPHADDLIIVFNKKPVKHFTSQGQNRAIVLALKTAELQILTRKTSRVPMLLLDDVSSELDRKRNKQFFALLADLGAQVFLSTTHPEFIILEDEREDFFIENGVIEQRKLEVAAC